jgi:hypothetical protein
VILNCRGLFALLFQFTFLRFIKMRYLLVHFTVTNDTAIVKRSQLKDSNKDLSLEDIVYVYWGKDNTKPYLGRVKGFGSKLLL